MEDEITFWVYHCKGKPFLLLWCKLKIITLWDYWVFCGNSMQPPFSKFAVSQNFNRLKEREWLFWGVWEVVSEFACVYSTTFCHWLNCLTFRTELHWAWQGDDKLIFLYGFQWDDPTKKCIFNFDFIFTNFAWIRDVDVNPLKSHGSIHEFLGFIPWWPFSYKGTPVW